MSALRRFEVKIGDFVTKCRSGFWHGAGEQKRMLQAARQNVGSKPPTSCHAAPFVPFGDPPRDRRGVPVFPAFVGGRRGDVRRFRDRIAEATPLDRPALRRRRRERQFAGTVGFSTVPPNRQPTLPVKFFRSLYRSAGSASFSPVKPGRTSRVRRFAAMILCHCTPEDGLKSSKDWGRRRASSVC